MRINEIAPKTNLNCSLYYKREKEGLLGRHKRTAVHFRSVNVDLLCKAFLYCNNQLQPFSKLGFFSWPKYKWILYLPIYHFSFMFLDLTYPQSHIHWEQEIFSSLALWWKVYELCCRAKVLSSQCTERFNGQRWPKKSGQEIASMWGMS